MPKCPVTGGAISTGIDSKDITPEILRPQNVQCYHCEQIHVWRAVDVFFIKSETRPTIPILISSVRTGSVEQ